MPISNTGSGSVILIFLVKRKKRSATWKMPFRILTLPIRKDGSVKRELHGKPGITWLMLTG